MPKSSYDLPDISGTPGMEPGMSALSEDPGRPPYVPGNQYNILNIYNPANQSRSELIRNFVVRIKEFNEILVSITDRSSADHFIIQGQRGSGKTTLLLRLYYELKGNPAFEGWMLPIRFDEEQYQIRTLYKLWENIALYLEEEYEHAFPGIYEQMMACLDENDYDDRCFQILSQRLRASGKSLILFIDNFGDMLAKFQSVEFERLAHILQKEKNLRIVGGSSLVLDYYQENVKSLHQLFRIIQLEGLDEKETEDLLLKLGEFYNALSVKEIISKTPGRIETLRRLTSGVPRTIVLLFEIFVDHETGDSFRDLEIILDRVTPLYKHRMDDLSAQQQEIVHAIAMNWDAVGVKEISRITRMESKAVSAQLKQLENNHVVIRIKTNIKNHYYQINERFFNIWYLMRYGRRKERNKVLWLVRFLENWCNREELIVRAENHVQALRKGRIYERHALFMTEALSLTDIPEDLQYVMIRETRRLLSEKNTDLLNELSKSDKELYNAFAHHYSENDYAQALRNLLEIRNKTGFVLGMTGFLYELHHRDFTRAESYYLQALKNGYYGMLTNLAGLYETEFKDLKKAEKYYMMAFKQGTVAAIYHLALLYQNAHKNIKKAIHFFEHAIERGHVDAMNRLALLYQSELKDYSKAAHYFNMAVEHDHIEAMNNLAWLHFISRKGKKEALTLLDRAFQKTQKITNTYVSAMVLLWNNQYDEAIIRAKDFMDDETMVTNFSMGIEPYLMLLIAKRQYRYTHHLFEENKFLIRDVYKPIYYALLHFMQDVLPDEHRRMGTELQQTVHEIIDQINQLASDYA